MLKRAEEEEKNKQKGEEGWKLAAAQTSAVLTASNSGSRWSSPHVPLISPHTTQHRGKHGNSNFTSALLLPGEGDNARVNPQLSRFELMRGDGTHWSRRQVHPQADTTGELEALRGCVFTPLPSFTRFRRFFPLGYPLPWLVEDQTITFHRVLNNEKKVGFPFLLPEDPPLGMTLPSLTAERTPFPAQRSPPPSTTSTGEELFQTAAPWTARPSSP